MMLDTSLFLPGVPFIVTSDQHLRFASPPWHSLSPEWHALDSSLPVDHLARLIDRAVDLLDLSDLFSSYRGVGSLPLPPDVLLKIVLYEMHDGELRPTRWARHCRESIPLQWLAFGLQPSRSSLYAFRDRVRPLLDIFNAHILRLAYANRPPSGATRTALDGTLVAAQGSRHKLLTQKSLDKRLPLLQAAIAQDCLDAGAQPPGVDPAANAPPLGPVASAGEMIACPPDVAAADNTPASLPTALADAQVLPGNVMANAQDSSRAAPETSVAITAAVAQAVSCADASATALANSALTSVQRPAWMANTPKTRQRQHANYQETQQRLHEMHRRHDKSSRRQAKANRRQADKIAVCPSEPQAALGRSLLYYLPVTPDGGVS
jgi:transposase